LLANGLTVRGLSTSNRGDGVSSYRTYKSPSEDLTSAPNGVSADSVEEDTGSAIHRFTSHVLFRVACFVRVDHRVSTTLLARIRESTDAKSALRSFRVLTKRPIARAGPRSCEFGARTAILSAGLQVFDAGLGDRYGGHKEAVGLRPRIRLHFLRQEILLNISNPGHVTTARA